MSGFNAINLSGLPAPEIVEALDYEAVLAEMLSELRARDTAFSALVESDPAYKVLEVAAYRETLLRQRVNDAAKAVMVAYAAGADLDHLAALVPIERKLIDPGDPAAIPPIPATYESDADFRRRVQLAPEGFSTAGPDGAYIFHALGVSGVKDVAVTSPAPTEVVVSVLSREGNGIPSQSLMDAVALRLNDADVRPLTDYVRVEPGEIIPYQVDATIYVLSGPSPDSVEAAARAGLARYVADCHVFGIGAAISGLYEALHVAGVVRVSLNQPLNDVAVLKNQAAFCESVSISVEVV